MTKRCKNTKRTAWAKPNAGCGPINELARRVVGHGIPKLKHIELLEKAKRTTNPAKRSALLAEAHAAIDDYESRMIDKTAEAKAHRALMRAAWLRENEKH